MTDQELVQGIVRRDEAIFREVVDCFQQHVIRTCYALVRDDQDARDLAQEVFIEVLESACFFRNESKLSTWIYRIAINKSLNHLKQQKRKQIFSRLGFPSSFREKISEHTADSGIEEKEMKRALHTAIDKLPSNQKIAFTLHKYEELPYKEIAAIMNVTVSSVESLIHRAKLNLQKLLSDYYEGKR